jgi:hypothetical protein
MAPSATGPRELFEGGDPVSVALARKTGPGEGQSHFF